MSRVASVALLCAAMVVVPAAAQDQGKRAHDVLVEVPTVLAPESKAAARVVVFETKGVNKVRSLADAAVDIVLLDKESKTTSLFSGKTGASGSVDASFTVPALAEGDYTLAVKTKSDAGEHTAPFPVKLQRDFRIMLVSDKPLYQPGQLMHLRALAVDAMTMRSLGGQEITFEIEDSKGNKVFKRTDHTSEYGISAIDFQLADEVLMGNYKVTATLGSAKSEKTVVVKKYVLPKFKLEVRTDKAFYRPQEKVKGTIQADYFFGKPVKGEALVKASTFDVAFREFQTVRVPVDAKGSAEFEIQLPDTFVGQPLEKGNAFVQFEVAVTDTADHSETVTKTASVCSLPLLIGAVPESGKIVPGVENIVYVLASSPDGAPVEAEVAIKTPKQELKGQTNASGFAALRLTPAPEELTGGNLNVTLSAKDRQGNEAKRDLPLSSEHGKDQILLRPAGAILREGESLGLDLFGTFDKETAFIDVVRRGQTILTTTCGIERGRGHYDLPLTADLFGSLEIHAYVFMGSSHIVRDSRVIFVQPAQELKIEVSADREQYLPGQDAAISFRVTDAAGKGVQSALGVIVVDESVYALQEMQPGFEKIYFMLQKELMEPKIEIKWSGSIAEALDPGPKPEEAARRMEAAVVLLAPIALPERRASVNTMGARVAQMNEKLEQIYWAMQSYIGDERAKFWVEAGGKRAMNPAILDEIVENAKNYKLPKEALVDPWGNKLTIADLAGIDDAFTFDYWARLMSQANVQAVFTALVQWAVKDDPTAPDALERMAKDGRLIKADQLKDYFGESLTMDRLAKEDAAFANDNLVRIADNARKQAIFNRLAELAGKEAIITSERQYVPGVMEKVAAGDWTAIARRPDGGEYDIETLAKENGAFAASNIVKIASVSRRANIYGAIGALAGKGGFDKVVEFDGKAWAYKKDVLKTLVAEKLLEEGQTQDIAGQPFDLGALSRDDAQFAAQNVVGALLRGAADLISTTVCNHIHSANNALPEDAIGKLVRDGALKAEQVTDPWGTTYKLVPIRADLPGNLSCGLLSGRFTLVAAGPDRKFDTADDINVGAVSSGGVYQPNYGGCAFYQNDPAIRWLTVDRESDHNEAEDGLGFRAGGRAEFQRKAMAPMRAMMALEKKGDVAGEEPAADPEGGATRIREYFPETLAWVPALITDVDGRAQLALTMADSITTWRMTASASTVDGRLGSTSSAMLVFQDFFVDIDLPVSLTQGDVVSVPVAVYNYLKEKQTVTLTLASDSWFELRDDAEKSVEMEPGQVRVVYYRIRAKELGASNKLEIQARGAKGAKDAIRRSIEIVPDGKMFETVYNGQLAGEIRHTVTIPANSVEGASKILFKAYPGIFASVLDGLEGMLRMPGG